MALINCTECGNQVSDKAASCPRCGAPVSGMASAATPPPPAAVPASPAPLPGLPLGSSPSPDLIEQQHRVDQLRADVAALHAAKTLQAATPPRRGVRAGFVVVLLVCLAGFLLLWRSYASDKAAPPSAGPLAALRDPQKVVDEVVELQEGGWKAYSFQLASDARVQVQVTARPKSVDVMLMTQAEFSRFQEVSGELFGGRFTYRQALSSQKVREMDSTEVLPEGNWAIVVKRPVEAILFGDNTTAEVDVTVY